MGKNKEHRLVTAAKEAADLAHNEGQASPAADAAPATQAVEQAFPANCPVEVLCVSDCSLMLKDATGAQRLIAVTDNTLATLESVFAQRMDYALWAWPLKNDDGSLGVNAVAAWADLWRLATAPHTQEVEQAAMASADDIPRENRLFTKVPVTIEAVQFDVSNPGKVAAFMQGHDFGDYHFENPEGLTIKTLEGDHLARPGDFVIRGVNGEFYPCKPDIFAKTYQPGQPFADEDAAQMVAHEGAAVYEGEWNLCLTLAFAGTGCDILTDWGAVPFELAMFMRNNPTAPVDAALIHVKRTLKIAVLPNEDPRRVAGALTMFKNLLAFLDAIDREDGEARRLAAEAEAASTRPRRMGDTEGGPFEMEQGGLAAPSDFALKK